MFFLDSSRSFVATASFPVTLRPQLGLNERESDPFHLALIGLAGVKADATARRTGISMKRPEP